MLVYVNGYLGGAEGTEGERIRGFSLPEKYVLQGGKAIFRLCRAGTAAELLCTAGAADGAQNASHIASASVSEVVSRCKASVSECGSVFQLEGLFCIASLSKRDNVTI